MCNKLKILIAVGSFLVTTCFFNVECKDKGFDRNLKILTTNRETLERNTKYLSLRFEKGYTETDYNVITLYIASILEKNEVKIEKGYFYNVLMPVGRATTRLKIDFNVKNKKNAEHYLKKFILESKLNNIIKKDLKNEKKLKGILLNCVEKYEKILIEEKNKIEKILNNIKKEKEKYSNENDFYIEKYGKPAIYYKLEKTRYLGSDSIDHNHKMIPDDFIQNYEENRKLEELLKNKSFLIKLGKILYAKDIDLMEQYCEILKERNKFEKELKKKHKENTKEDIVNNVISCLKGGVETDKELFNGCYESFYESIHHLRECLDAAHEELDRKNKKKN